MLSHRDVNARPRRISYQARRLREAIEAAGLPKQELAQRVGTSPQVLSRILAGQRISPERAVAIAGVLGRPVEDLFESVAWLY